MRINLINLNLYSKSFLLMFVSRQTCSLDVKPIKSAVAACKSRDTFADINQKVVLLFVQLLQSAFLF